MTNRQFVLLGNLGEFFGWQLVLFPVTWFLLVKAKSAVTRRREGFRNFRCWKLVDILLAEIFSYFVLVMVAVILTVAFDKQKVMYDPEPCSSPDQCRRGSLKYAKEMAVEISEGSHVMLYRMEGNSSGKLRDLNVSILYTHGNSGNVASLLPRVSYMNLLEMGADVYTWDPPGFGRSGGDPSFVSWMNAADIVADALSKSEKHLILYGRSLGGAVSVILAAKNQYPGVILEVPLDSMQWLFHDFFRLTSYAMGPLWHDNFNAYDVMAGISTCLFHYAAEQDELITDYRQRSLNAQARNRMQNCSYFLVGEGKWHNDVSWDVDYHAKMLEFLTKAVATKKSLP